MHQEPEHQVVAGQRPEKRAQPLAGAQPTAESRTPSRSPTPSWPMKVTRPSSRTPRVAGLPMSWNRAPKRSASRARELIGERLVEHRRQRLPASPNSRLEIVLELDLPGQHLDRVVVHIEVVEVALLHAVQVVRPLEALRAVTPSVSGRAQAGDRSRTITRLSSAKTRSPDASAIRGAAASSRERLGLGARPRDRARWRAAPAAAAAAGRLRRPLGRAPAAGLPTRSVIPPWRSISSPPAQRARHRVDAEVALGEIGLDRRALERRDVAVSSGRRALRARQPPNWSPTGGRPGRPPPSRPREQPPWGRRRPPGRRRATPARAAHRAACRRRATPR